MIKEVLRAMLLVCILSTTALNLAFGLMPVQMTALVKDMAHNAPS